MNVKIRYNTLATGGDSLRWRVIIDEAEYLVENIRIEVPSYTTEDYVFDAFRNEYVTKFHISCECSSFGMVGDTLIIK